MKAYTIINDGLIGKLLLLKTWVFLLWMLISKRVALNIHRMHAFGIFDKSVFNKKYFLHVLFLLWDAQFEIHYPYITLYVPLKYFMSFTQKRLRLRGRSWLLLRRCSKSLMVFRRISISLFFSSWRCCSFCKNASKGLIVKHHLELCNNIFCYCERQIL